MTSDNVFLGQNDSWNCGVAGIAYILEFYVHQINGLYLLNTDQYTLKKKGDH